ncbi:formimidoylglutamate deiminase [Pantoea sp. LMR881]|uniref:formimidoylglutamate deiminase n=1 Tax=Pantoea sp. LMR881 TaxID=3014336 RepID=UPI0022AEA64A|nr:formimidoylglutamate deiminase [Pantoea sp. LMR881]MCZ4058880.1 formimidoylglutamate deiminase [Pantoea sp. LMR881]
MATFFAARALLTEGWRHRVRISVNQAGFIEAITPDSPSQADVILQGDVIPGMANLHSHAFQRAMAGLAEVAGNPQDSFWTWRDLMYRMVQRLTPHQTGDIAAQLYIDMLKGGYTQVAEFHYLHHDPHGVPYPDDAMLHQLIAAADTAGIGQTLLPVLYSYSGFGAQPPAEGQKRFVQHTERYLQQQCKLRDALRNKPLQNQGLCFHSLRAVSETQMQAVLAASDATLPVHIHVAEQEKEVNDCLAWQGERPVSWLMNRFNVDARWCLIHATHLDSSEIDRLALSGAVAGLCPTTEANLGDGIFPAVDYIARGGRWGIGSDSHVSLSALEELRWLEYGQRLRDRRRNRITMPGHASVGDLLWHQAARGGAQACGIRSGELAVGQRADWLVLRDETWFSNIDERALLNRWLFAGQREHIRDVYVAGRQLINDGHHSAEEACATRFKQAMAALR